MPMNSPTRRALPKLYPPELSDAGAIENAPTEATSTDGQEMDSPTRRVLPELYPPERSGAEAIEKAPKEADCTDGEEIVPEQLEAQSYSDDDGEEEETSETEPERGSPSGQHAAGEKTVTVLKCLVEYCNSTFQHEDPERARKALLRHTRDYNQVAALNDKHGWPVTIDMRDHSDAHEAEMQRAKEARSGMPRNFKNPRRKTG